MSAPHDLLNAALAVRANAHAPYSGYGVGAALRTAEGAVFAGANVENASFPEGCCAETAAIAAMVAAGGRQIAELCVLGPDGRATAPCGGCCQRIAEFAGPATLVHMRDATGAWRAVPLGRLLPQAFSIEQDAGR